jgi:hypothetical protein
VSNDPPHAPGAEPAPPRVGNLLWHHLWTAVLAANLVMPMSLAEGFVAGGEAGMALAVGVLWLIGDLAGVRRPALRAPLLAGGLIVALTQFLPFPQLAAGMVGIWLGGRGLDLAAAALPAPALAPVRVFVETSVTGGLLLLFALWAGLTFTPTAFLARPAGPPPTPPGSTPPATPTRPD